MRTQAGSFVAMAARVGAVGGTSSARRRRVVTRREEQQEGEVHEENDALRSQTTPLPGARPGVPVDPGPP